MQKMVKEPSTGGPGLAIRGRRLRRVSPGSNEYLMCSRGASPVRGCMRHFDHIWYSAGPMQPPPNPPKRAGSTVAAVINLFVGGGRFSRPQIRQFTWPRYERPRFELRRRMQNFENAGDQRVVSIFVADVRVEKLSVLSRRSNKLSRPSMILQMVAQTYLKASAIQTFESRFRNLQMIGPTI
jgi:hypothetical protein